MNKQIDSAMKAYSQKSKEIGALASSVKTWAAELEQCNADASRFAELRLQALMRDDPNGAESYASQLAKCKARSEDLTRMIERRTKEVEAALAAQWAVGDALRLAQFEEVAAAKLLEKNKVERLAPEYNRALAAYAAAEARLMGLAGLEAEALNLRNQRKWIDEQLAMLRGEVIENPYIPAWLQNETKEA